LIENRRLEYVMPKRPKIEESSGNIYADLGFADPELERAKADLAREIRSVIDIRGMTQVEAGKLLGVDQADISRITRGRLGGYSFERLITMLSRLDIRVEIRVIPSEVSTHASTDFETDELDLTDRGAHEAEIARLPELIGVSQ
jgi:predicted XRE-type DNA-binding protein